MAPTDDNDPTKYRQHKLRCKTVSVEKCAANDFKEDANKQQKHEKTFAYTQENGNLTPDSSCKMCR